VPHASSAAIDVHQHLWPPEFVEALRRRTRPPRLKGWDLELVGEPVYEVDPSAHDPITRAELDTACEQVLLGLSSPLGVEELDPREAAPLLDAWHAGVAQLPRPFRAWASVNHVEPDHDLLRSHFDGGFVGLQIPSTQLQTPRALERCAATLRVCELADKPVLVHAGAVSPDGCGGELPAWWSPVVEYVRQLHASWWSWQAIGRSLLPTLRICFTAGAGLAPLHHERYAARGGVPVAVDPNTFVDTSTYGPRGLDGLIRVLGIDPIVMGSDRPYAEHVDPQLGAAASHAMRVVNPRRLLEGTSHA
jgi:hypothetical protein